MRRTPGRQSLWEQAVAKAGLDKDKLRKAISTGTFDTIIGKVRFGAARIGK